MSLLMASAKPISGLGPREAKIKFLGRPPTPTHNRPEGEDRVTCEFAFLRHFVSVAREYIVEAGNRPQLLLAAPGEGVDGFFEKRREPRSGTVERPDFSETALLPTNHQGCHPCAFQSSSRRV